ncbi:MAG: Transposase, partial [Holophagaceae bacterium]|nr:Transposase [Holophagaceae bacterium]
MGRVTDQQVRKLREEMAKHGCAELASIRSGMHRNTGRKYLHTDKFPTEMKEPRDWRTRLDPFEGDWSDIERRLGDAPELEARILFEDLMRRRPGVYQEGQLRTFQRRVKEWRAHHGPDKEVFFPQEHRPGEAIQTDFTWVTELGVTIQGEAFPHLLCHVVLPFSNWSWITVCQSESMLALRRGVPAALIQLGRVPQFHQTDNSTAATHEVAADKALENASGRPNGRRRRGFNEDYLALMRHYDMQPRTIGIGKSEQNGDVEALNGALKRRLNQHLLLRGSRDFSTVESWEAWAQAICRSVNERRPRLAEELAAMRPLRVEAFQEFDEIRTRVTTESTLVVKRNTYSV